MPRLRKIPLRFNLPEGLIVRKNRRRMAWTSLISMIAIVALLMFVVDPTRITTLSAIVETLFYCLSAIVLAYNGVALYDDKNLMKPADKEKNDDEEEAIEKGPKK